MLTRNPIFLDFVTIVLIITLTGCDLGRRRSVNVIEEEAGIRLTLWSQRSQYREWETVHIRATLENISDQTVVLEKRDKPVFDISYVIDGESVLWSEQNPGLATNRLELEPGEKFEIELRFIPLQAGHYGFRAHVWTLQGSHQVSMILSISYGAYYK